MRDRDFNEMSSTNGAFLGFGNVFIDSVIERVEETKRGRVLVRHEPFQKQT